MMANYLSTRFNHKTKKFINLSIKMHDNLSEQTNDYFNNPIVISATFLDPRHRKFHFIKDD
jgi:hypothetical protein